MTVSVIFATNGSDGRPSASLPFRDGTVVARLQEQLASFRIHRQIVITRPGAADAVRAGCGAEGCEVIESASVAEDLRTFARIAREAGQSLVIAHADLVANREALAGLLADPKATTGSLVTRRDYYRALRVLPRVRVDRGLVVSAGSEYHVVSRPNATFLGLLRVDPEHHEALAHAADDLAALSEKPPETPSAAGPDTSSGAVAASDPLDPPAAPANPGASTVTMAGSVDLAAGCQPTVGAGDSRLSDVPALLLVGLVRSGAQVSPRYLRGLHCLRATDTSTAQVADEELREIDEDRLLLDSAVKGSDGFFTTHFVSPYSKFIARWAARHGLSPNTVTVFSMVLGVIAAACFATGSRAGLIAGALVLQAAFTFDCVDGQLARYTRQFSLLGAWLDSVFDRAKEYVVYAGLAVGAVVSGAEGRWGVWTLAIAALILQSLRHLIDFSYGARRRHVVASLRHRPLDDPEDGPVRPAPTTTSTTSTVTVADVRVQPAAPRPSLLRRIKGVTAAVGRESERVPALYWFKRMIVLPIGERFALISVTAAFYDARVTFWALLLWGGVAACYVLTGRILRSLG